MLNDKYLAGNVFACKFATLCKYNVELLVVSC